MIVDLQREVFEFAYRIAMREATLQQAYPYEKDWLWGDLSRFPNSTAAIHIFFNILFSNAFDSQEDYNERLLHTCISVCREINSLSGNNAFTFGNAQKLVHIMEKYFYLSTFMNANRHLFRYCHCPMDQVMLQKVWEMREEYCTRDIIEAMGTRKAEFTFSWGNEDFLIDANGDSQLPRRYVLFQKAVRMCKAKYSTKLGDPIYPLEFDYCEW